MGLFEATSSSSLGRSSPVASSTNTKLGHLLPTRQKFITLFSCKPRNSVSCCSNVPANSSSSPSPATPSYSRRWYNPLRQRRQSGLDAPEIVRHWIDADPHPLASEERFTLMSYSILGDRNAFKHKDLYPNVPLDYLKWNHRKRLICKELTVLNPDVICMQEVDKFFDLFSVMEKAGYGGSYKRRTGDNVDGCAMFWKANKFQLLEEVSIRFREFGLRDNVAQLSVFEAHAKVVEEGCTTKDGTFVVICVNNLGVGECFFPARYKQMRRAKSRKLVVGNIHVLYNPNRGEVKLGQISLFSSRAQMLSQKWDNASVVLAGDFNITPQSGIYKFLSSSELNIKSYDKRNLSGQRSCHPAEVFRVRKETSNPFTLVDSFWPNCWTDEEVKIATGNAECDLAAHPLNLNSSYASVKDSVKTRDSYGEPVATSYHYKFFGTVDYLWYSGGLIPTRVLDTLPVDILRRTGGLPCKKLSSDHLALVSEFAFAEDTNEKDLSNTIEDGH